MTSLSTREKTTKHMTFLSKSEFFDTNNIFVDKTAFHYISRFCWQVRDFQYKWHVTRHRSLYTHKIFVKGGAFNILNIFVDKTVAFNTRHVCQLEIGLQYLNIFVHKREVFNTSDIFVDKRKIIEILLYSHLYHHSPSQRHNIKDTRRKTQEETKQEDFFTNIFYLSLYCKGSQRVTQGLHVRGCWRPNINFIFWPHCYDRHVESFLFSWCWGQLHRGFEGPLGRVWLSLPHLVSSCLEFYWQLLWNPTQLNYIIIQPPHDRLLDLWNRMFNRHQAEITVMQFTGHSLPVHHCSGTVGPSPCPIL